MGQILDTNHLTTYTHGATTFVGKEWQRVELYVCMYIYLYFI